MCSLASHFSHPAQFSKSKMAVTGTCILWFIHPFLLIHSFIHLLCARHCAKCSKCKVRHGPCYHAAYIPVRETSSHHINEYVIALPKGQQYGSIREYSWGIGLYEKMKRSWSAEMFKEGFPEEKKFELVSERRHR